MKKHAKWLIVAGILLYLILLEVYKGGDKLPWTLVFSGVVVCLLYLFWKKKG